MKKKDFLNKHIVRATDKEVAAYRTKEREDKEVYAMNMLQLQENVGLTYKEAKAFIDRRRGYCNGDIATWLDVSVHSVYNLQRKAKKKIAESGLSLEEIFGDYYTPEHPGTILICK